MYVVETLVTDSIKDTRLTVLRFLPFLGSQKYIHRVLRYLALSVLKQKLDVAAI